MRVAPCSVPAWPFAVAVAVAVSGCFVPPPEEVVTGKSCDEDAGHACAPGYLCCLGTCVAQGAGCCQPEADPDFCARLGKNCDPFSGTDNCGAPRFVNCGSCTGNETCGGGGLQNVCGAAGCTAESDAAFCSRHGKQCGSYTGADNCGASRTASCGTCSTPPYTTCSANACVCTPQTDAQLCAALGVQCGTATGPDNCGVVRTVSCSACPSPATCGGGGTAGQCGCIALGTTDCMDPGAVCCAGLCSGSGRCCRPLGDACTGGIGGECCQGSCDPYSGTCCKSSGSCLDHADCCSGYCDEDYRCFDL